MLSFRSTKFYAVFYVANPQLPTHQCDTENRLRSVPLLRGFNQIIPPFFYQQSHNGTGTHCFWRSWPLRRLCSCAMPQCRAASVFSLAFSSRISAAFQAAGERLEQMSIQGMTIEHSPSAMLAVEEIFQSRTLWFASLVPMENLKCFPLNGKVGTSYYWFLLPALCNGYDKKRVQRTHLWSLSADI